MAQDNWTVLRRRAIAPSCGEEDRAAITAEAAALGVTTLRMKRILANRRSAAVAKARKAAHFRVGIFVFLAHMGRPCSARLPLLAACVAAAADVADDSGTDLPKSRPCRCHSRCPCRNEMANIMKYLCYSKCYNKLAPK